MGCRCGRPAEFTRPSSAVLLGATSVGVGHAVHADGREPDGKGHVTEYHTPIVCHVARIPTRPRRWGGWDTQGPAVSDPVGLPLRSHAASQLRPATGGARGMGNEGG